MNGIAYLLRRIEAFDAQGVPPPDGDIARFVDVMVGATSADPRNPSDMLTVAPADADQCLARCRLLRHLRRSSPHVVTGPLWRDGQYWISRRRPAHLAPGVPILAEEHFTPVGKLAGKPSTKPFRVGLFTCSGVLGAQGMWRVYLDLYGIDSRPWHVWSVGVDSRARIREVATASDWMDFVHSYATELDGLIFPNWIAASQDYDGVHVTATAIAAVQGLCLADHDRSLATMHWDVESTFWLRWCFADVQLVEVVPA